MTDITNGPAVPRKTTTTELVAQSLKRRHRKQLRLQWIGIGAISIAFVMLFILVSSLVSTGWQAFTQTHLTLQVYVDPAEIPADRLPRGDFDDALAASLGQMLPDAAMDDRETARAVEGILSDGAQFRLRDMVVADNEALTEWLNGKLREVIWPTLAAQFGLHTSELWLQDAFVVRYEPDGQRGLAPHLDDSELSFNIALSDPDAFSGGGTSFEAAGQTLRPQQGQMVSHFGRVFHAGEPVTSGTRHILAGFVCARSLAREWRDLRPQAGQRVNVHGEQ